MSIRPAKKDKREVRKGARLTRPPRMEGKVKEAMMQPVRKPKAKRAKALSRQKPEGYSERQRKDYQLKSRRRG